MRWRLLSFPVIFLLMVSGVSAQDETVAEELPLADPGILPDSPFYFLDELFERLSVGSDPEKALRYKEEKIAEAGAMAERRKAEFVKEALMRVSAYNTILEKEVTPEMEVRIKQRSKAYDEALSRISAEMPELNEEVGQQRAQEERIRLAAEVSSKIKQLCETLAQLDAEQYERTCKTEDAPQWQQKLDRELTQEQQAHARVFAEKLRKCFASNGVACDCAGMRVPSFEAVCTQEQEKAVRCEGGDEGACEAMKGPWEFGTYLPAYLHPVFEKVLGDFSEQTLGEAKAKAQRDVAESGMALPQPCRDAALSSPEECMRLMQEQGLAPGAGFTFTSIGDFMDACTQRMSKEECAKQAEELERQGFTTEQPQAGIPERIGEFGRDCHAVKDLAEKSRCFEQFYEKAKQSFEMKVEWTDDGSSAGTDDWVSSIASKWFDTQTDEEHAQLKELLMEQLKERGIDAGNVKLELDDERFELRYVDASGAEFRYEYKRDSRFGEERYEEKAEKKHSDDDDTPEAGAPATEDERLKWEQYQKELDKKLEKELEESYEKYVKEYGRPEEAETPSESSGSGSDSSDGSSGSSEGSSGGGAGSGGGSSGSSGAGSSSGR